ncbi:2209_t:CDS:2, partial [Acaulospora colombiana]
PPEGKYASVMPLNIKRHKSELVEFHSPKASSPQGQFFVTETESPRILPSSPVGTSMLKHVDDSPQVQVLGRVQADQGFTRSMDSETMKTYYGGAMTETTFMRNRNLLAVRKKRPQFERSSSSHPQSKSHILKDENTLTYPATPKCLNITGTVNIQQTERRFAKLFNESDPSERPTLEATSPSTLLGGLNLRLPFDMILIDYFRRVNRCFVWCPAWSADAEDGSCDA